MTNTTKTEAAQAAQLLRASLKKEFPGTKFSVTSSNFANGDSVNVRWTDGPAHEAVDAVARAFSGGSFDGMTDSYSYDRSKTGPTAKFVNCSRRISDELEARVVADLRAMFDRACASNVDFEILAYRILRKSDLRATYSGLRSCEGFPGFEVVS